jgi:hypothetical protein
VVSLARCKDFPSWGFQLLTNLPVSWNLISFLITLSPCAGLQRSWRQVCDRPGPRYASRRQAIGASECSCEQMALLSVPTLHPSARLQQSRFATEGWRLYRNKPACSSQKQLPEATESRNVAPVAGDTLQLGSLCSELHHRLKQQDQPQQQEQQQQQ